MKRILFFFTLFITVSTLAQTTHTVTTTNLTGPGSIWTATANCVAGDTIRFSPSLIANGSDSIVLGTIFFGAKGVVIKGVFNATDTLYISGGNNSRIFSFNGAGRVVLDSLVLRNGSVSGSGGAVYRFNCTDTLFIFNSELTSNSCTQNGAAVYSEVSSAFNTSPSSSIVVENSIIKGNTRCGAIRLQRSLKSK